MRPISTAFFFFITLSVVLGTIYCYLWARVRHRREYLFFGVAVFGLASYSGLEYVMLFSPSVENYGLLLRLIHIPAFVFLVFLALFVTTYLERRRSWLFWSFIVVRTISLALNFVSPVSLNYSSLTELKKLEVFGEVVNSPIGQANPFLPIGQFALMLFVMICIDATVHAVSNGQVRKGLTVGGSAIILILAGIVNSSLVFWGILQIPLITTPFFFGIVLAMLFEITRKAADSFYLATALEKREAELSENRLRAQLVETAGRAGVWMRDLTTDKIWASDSWRYIFGFSTDDELSFEALIDRIHDGDRDLFLTTIGNAAQFGEYELQYRIVGRDGETKWIGSQGRVEADLHGKPKIIFGASVDITRQKVAEEAVHEMSGRLIGAQEIERARLARELHDDLSQSLALLSIKLEMLTLNSRAETDFQEQIDFLSSHLRMLATDVHRMSHELHPAKLEQLGLIPAVQSFCSEISDARGLEVKFDSDELPRELSPSIALCLYRVTQEALQNVAKHSGATNAKVALEISDHHVTLVISDNGRGFDSEAPGVKQSLGLVGMGERVRFVKGTFGVFSQPGLGCRVVSKVPFD